MKVNNKLPEVKILSETKINPQSLNGFMREASVDDDWEDSQLKRNLNVSMTDVEKFPEAVHCLKNETPESTVEFNKSINRTLLKHVFVTIGLNGVSQHLIFELSQTSELQLQTVPVGNTIDFWVNPCFMGDDKAAYYYGMAISETSKRVDELRKYIDSAEGTKEEKDSAVKRMYPSACETHCVASGSLYDWQRLIYEGTDFNKLDEMRYVLIELTRKFKLKYPSLFHNFVLVNKEGEEFGLDTVNSEDNGWRNYKVKIRGI